MTEVIKVVKRFCQKQNIMLEVLNDDSEINRTIFKNDGVMRITKHTKKEKLAPLPNGFIVDYYIEHNYNPQCISNKMNIVEVINILKEIVQIYPEEPCCVCYENCRVDIFKCTQCVNVTCNKCLVEESFSRNKERVFEMLSRGIPQIVVATEMTTWKNKCPICREEYVY